MPLPHEPLDGAPSIEALAGMVVEGLEAAGYSRSGVYALRGRVLRCIAQRGYAHIHDGIPPGVGVVGRTYARGYPSIVQDVRAEPGYLAIDDRGGAEVCLPLFLDDQVVAILNVESSSRVGDSEMVALLGYASRVEDALATLPHAGPPSPWIALSRETIELAALRDREDIMAMAAARAPGLVGLRSGLIRRVDTDRIRVSTSGPDAPLLDRLTPAQLNRIADWTAGHVSVFTWAPGADDIGLADMGLGSWAAVPLRGGHPADLLLVADSETRSCTSEGVQVLEVYASHITSALSMADAFDAVRFSSRRDAVTGLEHSSSFHEALVEAGGDTTTSLALMIVDVDHLRQVNDRDGHVEGDHVLRMIARRLDETLGGAHHLFRIGGDEFAVIARTHSTADVLSLAELIRTSVRTERVTVSVGVSVRSPSQLRERAATREMVAEADLAVQAAKRSGRNRVEVYSADMGAVILERARLATALSKAMARDQLSIVYQPLVSGPGNRVIGAEALMRWTTPDRGAVPPSEFIKVAEETGDIVAMGSWALREVVRQAVEWDAEGNDLNIGVNVSGVQLRTGFVAEVRDLLLSSGLHPNRLVLEITESGLVDDEQRITVIRGLRNLGVTIAIDDFGTGFSSLSYLRRLPIDILKIDRSFVAELDDPRNVAIAKTIIDLTRVLSLDCVAEGVETDAQLSLLSELGCPVMQGYLFARPMEADDFLPFARSFGNGLALGQGERTASATRNPSRG